MKDLYAGPLEEFVERRNSLARALREAGDRESAEEVRSLRKPTVGAWALNQLVRRRPSEVGRFFELAERLRSMQARAMGGGSSRDDLRETLGAYREAGEELSRAAAAILQEVGSTPAAHLPEVTASLQAAAVDDDARRQLREGTVTRPFPAPDLGALTTEPATRSEVEGPSGDEAPARQSPWEEQAAARAARDEARRRLQEAQQRLRAVEQAAERLNRRAMAAEQQAERLAEEAAEAAREAREARQRADEAAEEVRRARSELDEPGWMTGSADTGSPG